MSEQRFTFKLDKHPDGRYSLGLKDAQDEQYITWLGAVSEDEGDWIADLQSQLAAKDAVIEKLRAALELIGAASLVDQNDSIWVARDALKDYSFADLPSAPDWFKEHARSLQPPTQEASDGV